MTAIIIHAFFEDSTNLDGETGLSPTVDVRSIAKADLTNTLVVNNQAMTEIGGGLYAYRYASGTPITHDYVAVAKTTSSDVISKQVPALRWDGAEAWDTELERIDATISSVVLTNAATTAGSGLSGANLTLTNGVTFAETITGLTIPATWATAYLTVKANPLIVGDDDATNSIIQFKVTNNGGAGDAGDGIQYVNKAAATATEKAYGSITVDQGAGTLAVAVADDMAFSYIGNWTYDIKFIVDAGTSTKPVQSANWSIQLTETKTV